MLVLRKSLVLSDSLVGKLEEVAATHWSGALAYLLGLAFEERVGKVHSGSLARCLKANALLLGISLISRHIRVLGKALRTS